MSTNLTRVLLLTQYNNRKAWVDHLRDVCGFAVDHMVLDDVDLTELNDLVSDDPIILVDDRALTAATKTLLKQINSARPHCQVIICTALENVTETVLAELDDCHYLTEPISVELVGVSVRRAAKIGRMEREQFRAERIIRLETGQNHKLHAIAEGSAVAVKSARLLEQTERRARLLNAAANVSRDATSILDEQELLDRVVQLIVEHFDLLYHAGVFLIEKKWAVLKAASSAGGREMIRQNHRLEIGTQGIVGWVAKHAQPRLTSDVRKDTYHYQNPFLSETRAEMAFPLNAYGQLIGVLDVQSKEVMYLEDEDIATLQTMADQLANAINNARLYKESEERLEEANILQKVAVSLAGASELDAVLNTVMKSALQLTGTEHGGILLWDAEAEVFTQTYVMDLETNHLVPGPIEARTKGGLTRKIIDTQETQVIYETDQANGHNWTFVVKNFWATIGVPLLYGGEVIGVFYIRGRESRDFTERQKSLLETLAGQAAVAIDRASRYEELQHTQGLVGQITAVAWMGIVAGTWRHAIGNLTAVISDLVELIRLDLAQNVSPHTIENRLSEIIETVEEIQHIPMLPLSAEEGVESVFINELIRERIHQFQRKDGRFKVRYDLKLTADDVSSVRASPEWLRRVLDVIVHNAVNAMLVSDTKALRIVTENFDDGIQVSISDTGPGISAEIRDRLFVEPIRKQKGEKGAGLGLFLARTIVQTYGGKLTIGPTGPTGTTIYIWFPFE